MKLHRVERAAIHLPDVGADEHVERAAEERRTTSASSLTSRSRSSETPPLWCSTGAPFLSSEWVICRNCGLKYRTRESTCPRCENPTDEEQARWTDGGPSAPEESSGLAIAVPVGFLLGLIASYVFLGPLGGRSAGSSSTALVLAGLFTVCISWAWGMTLALRVSVASFAFSLLVPYVSLLVAARWKALLPQLGGTALVVFGVFVAPAGVFQLGPAQTIRRACEARSGSDCGCLGTKTVSLMTADERKADFVASNPQSAELLLTAASLCFKDRLVSRCVAAAQGNELQCICIIDRSLTAHSPEELEQLLAHVAEGSSSPSYGTSRVDCLAEIPSKP